MPTPLTEHLTDWRTPHVEIDVGSRRVRNITLTGLVSKNGYQYLETTLRDAVPLYAGKPVFLDHPPSPARPLERSTRDLVGSIVRPMKELKDFRKVALAPGESKTITFTIDTEKLSFYDQRAHWIAEPGEFELMIGASSRDIRLKERFTLSK